MTENDEGNILDFLGERPNFFVNGSSPELQKLQERMQKRGGIHNPYGVPLQKLGGIANPQGVINYLSGIFQSVPGKQATDFITGWAKTGIDQILHKVMSSNGNALEWFILEMLIQTKIHETGCFERPPLELDLYYAVDLLYISPDGLKAKGKTLGIQITNSFFKVRRFQDKRDKVKSINRDLGENKKLKNFGYKRPDNMSILGVYGKIGRTVSKGDSKIFCRDLGLPLQEQPVSFEESTVEESKDIADFIRMSITTWNIFYPRRRKYSAMQKTKTVGRQGNYTLEWRYNAPDKSTQFYFKKEHETISFFDILDAE